ncbi:hypothetical protein G4B88_005743 [Cannabis sativa]|uniref:Uncharacterized protein n=1 Tax=Cannabis sativa TaxID=3483 RepID=A0A7J6GRI0_CANSA|nr:hypothetical protein G4B88_005743 [Cannabis sativa]
MSGVRATTYAEVLEKALEAELCESRIQKDNTARWEARKASNGGGDNKRKLPSNQHNEADKRNKIGSNNYKGKKPYTRVFQNHPIINPNFFFISLILALRPYRRRYDLDGDNKE